MPQCIMCQSPPGLARLFAGLPLRTLGVGSPVLGVLALLVLLARLPVDLLGPLRRHRQDGLHGLLEAFSVRHGPIRIR